MKTCTSPKTTNARYATKRSAAAHNDDESGSESANDSRRSSRFRLLDEHEQMQEVRKVMPIEDLIEMRALDAYLTKTMHPSLRPGSECGADYSRIERATTVAIATAKRKDACRKSQ